MTDRELLEWSAKAAGLDYIKDCVWIDNGFYSPLNRHERIAWNPLIDDGAAFRLAVKLGINVMYGSTMVVVEREKPKKEGCVESFNDDPYAATRRAIVRAAAEIGRAL